MRIIAIGKSRDGPEAALVERYLERIRPSLSVTELPDGKGALAEIKRREGAALLAAIPDRAFVIALDLEGEMLDSSTFATRLELWLGFARSVNFLIGGAEGLDHSVVTRADFKLSLGRLTWPHLLARAMLVEQIYRARAIASGHPYHRAGRPG